MAQAADRTVERRKVARASPGVDHMDRDLAGQGDERRNLARQRANSAFRGVMLVFAIGFLAFAIVGYIVAQEVGIVVLFVCLYGLMVVVGLWGKRCIMRVIDHS